MPASPDPAVPQTSTSSSSRTSRWNTQDWWAVALGIAIFGSGFAAVLVSQPTDISDRLALREQSERELDELLTSGTSTPEERKAATEKLKQAGQGLASNPIAPYLVKLREWSWNPADAFLDKKGNSRVAALVAMFAGLGLLFGIGFWCLGYPPGQFLPGFAILAALAVLAQMLADQELIKHFNLEYALWALVVGLLISNTIGTPAFMLTAAKTEFYIKTGLVLLGGEVLFHRLVELGLPGICVAWVVTPIVLISTFIFGQRVLKMDSPSLNMVISADMSVCGVSAAIATAAACKAKKEELSLAIGLSLSFTVIMMVIQPAIIRALGMSEVLGGAWIGGTIDSTGAVAAAGGLVGETALQVAATVKMIQNILIGAVAFGVAVYWVTYVEKSPEGPSPSFSEVWNRFPRFILGFLAASIICTVISMQGAWGEAVTSAVIDGTSKPIRGWCFCLAFVSIGLETNFRVLSKYFAGGKPLVLYLCGQSLNLLLTLFMAWLMFEKVFPDAAASLSQ